jgi:hypothetical protein
VPGNCQTDDPALRLVAGDAHMAACHYAEELAEVTIDSLRASIDIVAEGELADITDAVVRVPADEPEADAVVDDVAVTEGVAHPGVTDRAEGQVDEWPVAGGKPGDGRDGDGEVQNP